jgi:hypothetical protein
LLHGRIFKPLLMIGIESAPFIRAGSRLRRI